MFLKLKKKYGENLSNVELMRKIFEDNLAHGEKIIKSPENEKIVNIQSVKVIPGDSEVEASRYASVYLRRNSLQKTGGKCLYPGCNRPPEIFHHTDRFANSQSHESLVPICKIHHEFAHNGLIKNENSGTENWRLQLQTGELQKIDRLYREYRKKTWTIFKIFGR
ncbi:hypothetical protein HZA40_02370 [Candidatus Peregrinibacteria bacterium]|nr:hypothetical protein [Candidatus Peregrinibacteria bacterium]